MDALQDLSLADAEELRAFSEKRKWFESRLEILECSPPIYPFLHPQLILNPEPGPSSKPYILVSEGDSSLKLPSAEQVKIWQSERDAMEEEVLIFDGGDLGRMKKKTRAATQHPLTPPSTHLVSITLSLKVLIDRLLTLLRHRGELLELTSLRLRWDDMRWAVKAELEKITTEADDIALIEGRWKLHDMSSVNASDTPLRGPMGCVPKSLSDRSISSSLNGQLASPVTISRSSTLPSLSSVVNDDSSGPPKTPQPSTVPLSPHTPNTYLYSPSNRNTPSKRNLQLPLLHSHITNLEIRHKNLGSNQLARSGALLDKMIDHAGPLKDLGGVHGPGTGTEGAVPDALLDLQDDLEKDVKMAVSRIALCRGLEEQWRFSDETYHSLKQAQQDVKGLLLEIGRTLSTTATSGLHQHSLHLLEAANEQLLGQFLTKLPRPTHHHFPDLDNHNDSVKRTLEAEHAQASQLLEQCKDGCTWYGRLAASLEALRLAQTSVTQLERNLQQRLASFNGSVQDDASARRPVFDNVDHLEEDHSEWVANMPAALADASEDVQSMSSIAQKANLAIMQYRQIVRSMPQSLTGPDHPSMSEEAETAEMEVDRLLDVSKDTSRAAEEVKLELQIWPIVSAVKKAVVGLTADIAKVKDGIHSDIHVICDGQPTVHDRATIFSAELGRIDRVFESEIVQQVNQLHTLLRSYRRPTPALASYFATIVAETQAQQLELHHILNLYKRVHEQARIVKAVEIEALEMLKQLKEIQAEVDGVSLDTLDLEGSAKAKADELSGVVMKWEAGLSQRVVFVSQDTGGKGLSSGLAEKSSDNIKRYANAVNEPVDLPLPRTLLPPFPGARGQSDKLALSDDCTRNTINNYSAKVSSALVYLENSIDDIYYKRWARQRDARTVALQAITSEWPDLRASIEQDLKLHTATDSAVEAAIERLRSIQRSISSVDGDAFVVRIGEAKAGLQAWLTERPDADRQSSHIQDDGYHDRSAEQLELATSIETQLDTLQGQVARCLAKLEGRRAAAHEESASARGRKNVEPDSNHSDGLPQETPVEPSTMSLSDLQKQDGAELRVQALQSQLDSLNLRLRSWVDPPDPAMQSTPHRRRLPGSADAEGLRSEVQEMEINIGIAHRLPDMPDDTSLNDLTGGLAGSRRLLARLEALVTFSAACRESDTTLSELLVALDSRQSSSESAGEVAKAEIAAMASMDRLRQTAQPVEDDPRVNIELQRITATSTELQGMIAGSRAITPITELGSDNGQSDTASTSTARTRTDTPTSRLPLSVSRNSVRSISGPFYTPSHLDASRVRAVSDTPSRVKMDSLRSGSGLPRPRKESLTLGRSAGVSLSSLGTPHSGTPKMSRGAVGAQDTPHARRLSRLPVVTKKTYVADPKSRLDVAVGRIVNNLDVNIPVVPVGVASGEEWKDQSGKYWIGAEGRAKLCFCRILRSKMVMVRVGGGWVELSKFLLDHFADAYNTWSSSNPPASDLGLVIGSSTPIRITSANLQPITTPARPSHTPRQSSITLPFSTPTRHSLPLLNASVDPLVTPVRTSHSSMSPSNINTNTMTSPLLPLHFIRKASESPPVREREKERMKAGRRSILGKEGIQAIPTHQ